MKPVAMRYIDEFRDLERARQLTAAIAAEVEPGRRYRLMEFCGGHTHAIFRYGLADLLPAAIELIHGPGCPVCVLPMARIDHAIALAEQPNTILCSYGDMLRVPGSERRSLLHARAAGADVRLIHRVDETLQIARDHPEREVILFAIGFETTTPPTAVALQRAAAEQLPNWSLFCNHLLTPAAIRAILEAPEAQQPGGVAIDGILGPSHVSTIIGSRPYEFLAATYRLPVVIAGFEPLDILLSIRQLVAQLNSGRAVVENQYQRAVSRDGNRRAQQLMADHFTLRDRFEWRGLGWLPQSALAIHPNYQQFDAEQRFSIAVARRDEVKGCECPAILRGVKKPTDCRLFGRGCTPDQPLGACMVSAEGACAAYWHYGRFRQRPVGESVA